MTSVRSRKIRNVSNDRRSRTASALRRTQPSTVARPSLHSGSNRIVQSSRSTASSALLHRAPAAARRQVLLHDQHRHDALGGNQIARRAHLAAEPGHEAAEHAHGDFRALRVATEPEQVVRRAAREVAAAAVQSLVRLPLREQAELLDGLIRQDPGVLAHVAGLEPRRARIEPTAMRVRPPGITW